MKNRFKDDATFDFLVHERSGLIYQLRVHDDLDEGVQKELWCVIDMPEKNLVEFSVQTLYDLRVSRTQTGPVFKDHPLTYRDIWSNFGLFKIDLTRTELHLACHLYLKTLSLYMP